MKWGHGCKIWDWSIILYYFAVYLTCMLTLGLRLYKSSNLVLDLKMWENFESNLSVCSPRSLIRTTTSRKRMMHFWWLLNNGRKVLFLVEYQVKRFEEKETNKTKYQFRWSQVWFPRISSPWFLVRTTKRKRVMHFWLLFKNRGKILFLGQWELWL